MIYILNPGPGLDPVILPSKAEAVKRFIAIPSNLGAMLYACGKRPGDWRGYSAVYLDWFGADPYAIPVKVIEAVKLAKKA